MQEETAAGVVTLAERLEQQWVRTAAEDQNKMQEETAAEAAGPVEKQAGQQEEMAVEVAVPDREPEKARIHPGALAVDRDNLEMVPVEAIPAAVE